MNTVEVLQSTPGNPIAMSNFVEQSESIAAAEGPQSAPGDSLERRVFRASVVVIATFAAAYVLWLLVDLLLLLFACTLVSLILLTITNLVRRRTGLPFVAALGLTVITIVGFLGAAITFFGTTIQAEFAELATRLPAAWENVQGKMEMSVIGSGILMKAQELAPSGETIVNAATTALGAVGGALSGLIIVLVGGLYLAAQPTLYSVGLLRMIPARARNSAAETLDAISITGRTTAPISRCCRPISGIG